MSKKLAVVALLLALPLSAWAEVVWRGDFETGDISQWTRSQAVSENRLQVVQDPVREGQWALKVTVQPGDNPIQASGNRNELLYMSREEPGSEYAYKWSTFFPDDYPSVNAWQLFAQWHHEGNSGSPPIELYTVGENMHLRVGGANGEIVWTAPLARGVWRDFVVRVKWSPDPAQGFVEMYVDGALAVPKKMVATMYGNERNYLKLGLYRDASISTPGVLFHDGFTQATSLGDVLGTAEPAQARSATASSATAQAAAAANQGEASTSLSSSAAHSAGPAGGCSTTGFGALAAMLALVTLAALVRPHKRAVATFR